MSWATLCAALDAWITYSFEGSAVHTEGIVYFREENGPGVHTWVDCLAFPPGGEWDTGQCRYMR